MTWIIDRKAVFVYKFGVKFTSIITAVLAALILWGLSGLSVASAEPVAVDLSVVTDQFCGSRPPSTLLCPKTGLKECRCFLCSKSATAETLFLQTPEIKTAPRRRTSRPLTRLLPRTEYRLVESKHQPSPLERPPRFAA